jgi:lipoprotein-anchoring transpeptidase ErfK/SrfK
MQQRTDPPLQRTKSARWAHRIVRGFELVVIAAVLAGGAFGVLLLVHRGSPAASAAATAAPGPRVPLRVTSVTPAPGAVNVAPTATVLVRFSAPIAKGSPMPALSPAVPGSWQRAGSAELRFVPSAPALPLATETLAIPGGSSGMVDTSGGHLASTVSRSWKVRNGSVLGMQQVLAELGYLPLKWTPAPGTQAGGSSTADLEDFYSPPAGQFSWRYAGTPVQLQDAWQPGSYNHMTAGAMVAFERKDGLPAYTSIRAVMWNALLNAELSGRTNPEGYTYALVSQVQPESLTLWHDGQVVYTSVANTGISQTPTPVGTFFVYRRFPSTTMSGTNPNGTYYLDHGVKWVNYFDSGYAIHGFVRASYGFPQSLGCVELPVSHAAVAYKWIHYGTVVTIEPEAS